MTRHEYTTFETEMLAAGAKLSSDTHTNFDSKFFTFDGIARSFAIHVFVPLEKGKRLTYKLTEFPMFAPVTECDRKFFRIKLERDNPKIHDIFRKYFL